MIQINRSAFFKERVVAPVLGIFISLMLADCSHATPLPTVQAALGQDEVTVVKHSTLPIHFIGPLLGQKGSDEFFANEGFNFVYGSDSGRFYLSDMYYLGMLTTDGKIEFIDLRPPKMTLDEAIGWCKKFITSVDKIAWWKRVQKNQEWRFNFYSPENQKSYDSIEQLEKLFRDKQHPISNVLIAVWRTDGKEEIKLDLDHLNADGSPIYNVGAYGPESKTPWAEPRYLVTVHISYVSSKAHKP